MVKRAQQRALERMGSGWVTSDAFPDAVMRPLAASGLVERVEGDARLAYLWGFRERPSNKPVYLYRLVEV